jgi:drug/metabolite transporter (DMT)-like permease
VTRRAWLAFAGASVVWGFPYLFIKLAAIIIAAVPLIGAGAILVAAAGYAIGPMILKNRLHGLDPRALMGGSLAVGALILTPLAALDPPSRVPPLGAFASLAVLGLVCTALAFVILTVLIREAGTSRAMVITYVNPVIAVALGVVLLGERGGWGPGRGRWPGCCSSSRARGFRPAGGAGWAGPMNSV